MELLLNTILPIILYILGAILLVVVDTSGGSITRLNDFLSNHYSKNKINKFPFNRIFLIPRNPPNYKDLFIEL